MNTLANLCDPVNDQCNPADAGVSLYIGLEHIDSGSFLLTRSGNPTQVRSAKTRFRAGDVLYGKLRPYLDKAVLATVDGICSTDILVFRPKPGISANYLLALFHTSQFIEHANQTTHGVNHPRTSWNGLSSFAWIVPHIEEQSKIASVLLRLQSAMELERRLIAAIKELKQAAMQQIFGRGMHSDTQRETAFGHLPESWPTLTLGDCCTVQSGITKGRMIAPEEAIEVPYLRVANVQNGHLDLAEVKTIIIRRGELSRYLLRDGDILLTEGGDLDKLGRGFIWRGELKECAHQNHIFAVRVNRDILLPEFLAYLVQSAYGRSYFLTVAHKTTNLASINSTKLKAFPVPIPSLEEQREVTTVLHGIDEKATIHERKKGVLRELFDTLLHDLMTGRIRVTDLVVDELAPNAAEGV